MANVFSDVATLQVAGIASGAARPNASAYGGKHYSLSVKKTAYTGATADPLYLAFIPAGTIFLPGLSRVVFTDPGDALTGKLGLFTTDATPVAIDDDAYGSGIALGSAAGNISLDIGTTIGDYVITPTRLTTDAWLVMTWTTATNAASHAQYWTLTFA